MTLREARKRKSLTQKELASIVGITPTALSFIENYKSFPRPETRKKIEKIFGNHLEFYSAAVLVEMISRFIGTDAKLGPQRGKFIKQHIDKVIQCVEFDIVKFKTKKP